VNPTNVAINDFSFSNDGIITTNEDKDVFKFDFTGTGTLHIDANPYSVGANNEGADLDIKLELLNSSFEVINTYDPITILNVAVDTLLNKGVYYVLVEGAGNNYTTNYGSLGSYTISGMYSPLSVLPIHNVTLAGKTDKDKHILSWNIVADEPVSALSLESSTDGRNFTTLTSLSRSSQDYSYTPLVKENIYYRLKAVSVTDQAIYSNVISLKSNNNSLKAFTISTMVHSEVTIHATGNYEYRLADMSGRILQAGKGKAGINTININNSPNGIYLIQLLNNNQRRTERIVRL
jgi:hypothetical protein